MTFTSTETDPISRLNKLRRGRKYRAATADGHTTGEYLGVETTHGVWSMLLRHRHGTASIPLARVTALEPLES